MTVFERNRAEDTFGFGVVFSDATLAGIDEADPVLRSALSRYGVHWDAIEVRVHGERHLCGGNGMAAVHRRTLLSLLQGQAIEAGVDVRFSTEVGAEDLLGAGYDLVIAADGAGSKVRDRFAEVFEPAAETAAAKFIWLGTTYPFGGLTFVHQRGPHGVFAVHGYPVGDGVSTFIVETDEGTWRAAGLDEFDVTGPPGPSDEKSRDYLQGLFAEQIGGHPLLVNNSRWGSFRTRRARRWRHRVGGTAIALLGDAAHTAHFSVGSGTKMAMEDAVALVDALDRHGDDADAALAAYEAVRQPPVTRIQGSARPSVSWWEHFGRAYDSLPPWQFAYHFFTRSLTDTKLRLRDDGFVAGVHRRWRDIHGSEPLHSPFEVAGRRLDGRAVAVGDGAVHLPGGPLPLRPRPDGAGGPWALWVSAPDAEHGLPAATDAVAKGVAAGCALVAVTGGTPLTRRLVCEAARLEHGAATLLVEDAGPGLDEEGALTAVLSGRTDLVGVPAGAAAPRREDSREGRGGEWTLMSLRHHATPVAEGVVPWPEDLARAYTEKGWWRGRALGAELLDAADRRPDATAVVDGDVRLSYRSLAARADALASRLVDELGLVREDRIVVQLPNCWEFVVLTLACLRAGVVPVMALPAHRRHELSYLAAHSEAVAIAVPSVLRGFDHAEMAEELRSGSETLEHVLVVGDAVRPGQLDLTALCAEPPDPGAHRERWDAEQPSSRTVALFLLSGGTTGLPKLIARTHDDYAYNARASAELCALGPDTVYLGALPVSHNFPLACPGILGTLMSGGRVVMLPSPEPERAFAAIAAEGVTVATAVPAVAQRWLAHASGSGAGQVATLRLLQVGGARIADELARRVRPVLGCTLQQVFGMAEGLLNYTRLDDPEEVICTTQGRPLSEGDEVRVVDGSDRDVPDGAAGALLTRGPYTPRGYYRAAEQNARAFTADGWYRSGDIVRRRHGGNLVVEGREKDIINRGGEKISAEEVENLAYQLPQVNQVAAVAMPDAQLGERVCLYAAVKPGAALTLDDIRGSMSAAGVAAFKWPERLEIVEALPTTNVGKIDKKALREDIARRMEKS